MTITTDHAAHAVENPRPGAAPAPPRRLWLDLTRKCQLSCVHCYNASGPDGEHGTMTREDWISVLDQAAALGISRIQFIGGEPTMHPDAIELVTHALTVGQQVEVFSNLVHITGQWWDLFQRAGVPVATSYYSDDAQEHNAITGRLSHRPTLANIGKAIRLGVPVHVGIVAGSASQRVDAARRELEAMGVTRISIDRVRAFGRAAGDQTPQRSELCGRCGTGRAAIDPNGKVSPCVLSNWLTVGNVQDSPLAAILGGTAMAEANASIQAVARPSDACDPDTECSPGSPGSGCNPRTK